MERAAIGEAQLQRQFGEIRRAGVQPRDGQVAADLVLQRLVALPFQGQLAAQGRGRHEEMPGERVRVRPASRPQAAQVGLDPRRQALRIAIADQDVGRRAEQEASQLPLVAADRQSQAVGIEQQAAEGTGETQVVAEHHPVVLDVVRLRTAQVDGQDRDAPADQPAGQAMGDHPQGEVGQRSPVPARRLVEDDFRQAAAALQARLEVVELQAEESQDAGQRRFQGLLVDRAAAHESEAATLQAPRVHAEELVVHAPSQIQPEPRIGVRGDPRVGFAEQLRIDTGGLEDLPLLAALPAPLHQRLADQAHRDGALGARLSLAVVLHPSLSPRCAPPATLAQERGAAPSSQSRPWRSASRRISSMLTSRMRNFWILPVTVIGNSSTNLKWRGILK